MPGNNQIRFGVGFDVKKEDLNEAIKSLQEIQRMTKTDFMKINAGKDFENVTTELVKVQKNAKTVQDALEKAFNPKINAINLQTFTKELKGLSIKDISESFSRAGVAGDNAFRNMAKSLLTAKTEAKETHKILESMGKTLTNTIKWSVSSAAVRAFSGSVQQAYGYVKALDGSLNDIRIVTQKSAQEMAVFADQANKSAKQLGTTTTNYTDAALTFYQQGLDDKEVKARTDLTMKVANSSGLNKEDAAEYVTAVLNGYKVGSEEAEKAMDILANVGAHTASSLSELSEAMSKVSSTASTMGVSEEQLASSLATVIQTTRQDASQVGTAFKTIFMRISDISAGTEDAEVSLGEYTGKMAKLGYNVLDNTGHLRDLGEVMEEIGGNWANMSREQQIALARTMAGTRQANNLLALFDNWSTYGDAMKYAADAQGTLQTQQDIYMESTAAHMAKMKASWEDVYDSLLKAENINMVTDVISGLGDGLATFVDGIGGLDTVITGLGGTALTVFSDQISKSLSITANNVDLLQQKIGKLDIEKQLSEQFDALSSKQRSGIINTWEELRKYANLYTEDEKKALDGLIELQAANENSMAVAEDLKQKIQEGLDGLLGSENGSQKYGGLIDDLMSGDQDTASKLDAQASLTALTQGYGEAHLALEAFTQEKQNYDNATQKVTSSEGQEAEEIKKTTGEVEQQQAEFKELESSASKSIVGIEKSIEVLKTKLDKGLMGDSTDEDKKALEEIIKKVEELKGKTGQDLVEGVSTSGNEIYQKITEIFSHAKTESKDLDNLLQEAFNVDTEKLKAASAEIDKIKEEWKKAGEERQFFNNIVSVTGAVSQLVSAFSSLANIPKIWSNENLTAAEKFGQTISALAMSVSMLSMAANTLALPALKGLTTALGGTVAEGASLGEVATALGGAFETFAGGLGLTAGALLGIIAAAAAAVAALALLVWWSSKINERNSVSGKLKQIEERTTALTESYNLLTESIQKMQDTADGYDESIKKIKELQKGTTEFKDAVEEANEKAKELIETYNLSTDDYSRDENGLITFSESGRQKVSAGLQRGETAKRNAEAELTSTKIQQNNLEAQKQFNNLAGRMPSAEMAALSSQIAESFRNNSDIRADMTDDELREVINTSSDFSDEMRALTNEIVANREAFFDYNNSLEEVKTANERYAEEIIQSNYGDSISQTADTTGFSEDTVSKLYGSIMVEGGQTLSEALQNIDVSDIHGTSDLNELLRENGEAQLRDNQALLDKYLQQKGMDNENFTSSIKGNKATITDSEGNTQEINAEEMAQAIASAMKRENILGQAESGISEVRQELRDAMAGLKTPKNNPVTKDMIDSSLSSADSIEDFGSNLINSLSPEQLKKIDPDTMVADLGLNSEAFSEIFTRFGYESGGSYAEALTKALNEAKDNYNVDSYISGLIPKAENVTELANAKDEVAPERFDMLNPFTTQEDALGLINQYNEALLSMASAYENTTDEASELTAAITLLNEATSASDIKEAQDLVEEKQDELEGATRVGELAKEYNLATEDIEAYAMQLEATGDYAEKSEADLADLAKTQLRYQRAVDNSVNSIADWKKQIKNFKTKKTIMDPDSFKQMTAAYGDLIDIDASVLDDKFLMNSKNADLMEKAINGDQDALEELSLAASKDIAAQVHIDDKQFKADQKKVTALLDEIGDKTITPDVDTAGVLGELDKMVNAFAMSADQAETYLAGMGIDAEIEEVTAENTDTKQVTSVTPNEVTEEVPGKVTVFSGGGVGRDGARTAPDSRTINFTDTYTGVSYETNTEDVKDSNAVTGTALKVKSAKKKNLGSGGNVNLSKKKAPSGGGGGSGKKGGGKKNKKSGKKAAKGSKTAIKGDADPYHRVNTLISRSEKELAKLEEKRSKIVGKDLLKNLEAQSKELEKQVKLQKEKLGIAEDELKKQREQIKETLNQTITLRKKTKKKSKQTTTLQKLLGSVGIEYDENDEFINYNEILTQLADKINEGYSGNKNKQDKLIEVYDKLKEQMDEYEETLHSHIGETETELVDLLYQSIENQAEAFNLKIQATLDLTSMREELADFQNEMASGLMGENYAVKSQTIVGKLQAYLGDTGEIEKLQDHVFQIMGEIQKLESGGISSIYSAFSQGSDTEHTQIDNYYSNLALAYEDLKTHAQELQDALLKTKATIEELYQVSIDSAGAVTEAFDRVNSTFDAIDSNLEHQINLIQMMYGEDAYGDMEGYYNAQLKNSQNQIKANYDALEYWNGQISQLNSEFAAGLMDKDKYKALFETYMDNWQASLDTLNANIEGQLDKLAKQYENTVRKSLDDLTKAFTDGDNLDYLNDELSVLSDKGKMYLDDINKAYELQKLQNQWSDKINQTTSAAQQKMLSKAMNDQLKALNEKDKLTKTDLERAQKVYDIAVKQAELEDARNNKNQMRLVRDASGNYAYQFVADSENVMNATQALRDAQNELYNFDKETYMNNLDEMSKIWNDYQEKIADAYIEYADDKEELEKRLTLLQVEYQDIVSAHAQENIVYRSNLEESAAEELQNVYKDNQEKLNEYYDNAEGKMKNMSELVPGWVSSAQTLTDGINTNIADLNSTVKSLFDDLDDKTSKYNENLSAIKATMESMATLQIKPFSGEDLTGVENILNYFNETMTSFEEDFEKMNNEVVAARKDTEKNHKELLDLNGRASSSYWNEQVSGVETEIGKYTDSLKALEERRSYGLIGDEEYETQKAEHEKAIESLTDKKATYSTYLETAKAAEESGTSFAEELAKRAMDQAYTPEEDLSNDVEDTSEDISNTKIYNAVTEEEKNRIKAEQEERERNRQNNINAVKEGLKDISLTDIRNGGKSVALTSFINKAVADGSWNDYVNSPSDVVALANGYYGVHTKGGGVYVLKGKTTKNISAILPNGTLDPTFWDKDKSNGDILDILKAHSAVTQGAKNSKGEITWTFNGTDPMDALLYTMLYNNKARKYTTSMKSYKFAKYLTGGLADFTGPAWLDGSKTNPELVLNAADTRNMLSTVSLIRDVAKTLAGSASSTIAGKLSGLAANNNLTGALNSLEQQVYITATFEGQTEAEQIQTALDNLINIAAQRAQRN